MLRVQTTYQPKEDAGKLLSEWLLSHRETPVLLMLSGGSALSILDCVEIPPEARLTLCVLDERFSVDPTVNNFLQLQATTFFARARSCNAEYIPSVPLPEESLTAFAARFEGDLRAWRSAHPDGVIIATLGIGADGHTAGMLPFPSDSEKFEKLFITTERDVVGYIADHQADTLYKERITVTAPFLFRDVAKSLIFAVGPEKAATLAHLQETQAPHTYPMVLLKSARNAVLITDLAVAF